jgi:hypothetical protein
VPQPDPSRRWDIDERGIGIADAATFAPRVEALAAAARETGWVAEDPDLHLWPYLHLAINAAQSPWRLVRRRVDGDGTLVVEVGHEAVSGPGGRARVRGDAFALLGTLAEGATFIEESEAGQGTELTVVTGALADQTGFRSHGHTLRLIVSGNDR